MGMKEHGPKLSTAALVLTALFCGGITVLLFHVFDACNLINFPPVAALAKSQTVEQCRASINAGIKGAPGGTSEAAEYVLHVMMIATRVEGAFFLTATFGALFTLTLPFGIGRVAVHAWTALTFFTIALVDIDNAGTFRPAFTPQKVAKEFIPFAAIEIVLGLMHGASAYLASQEDSNPGKKKK
mmetsp:Transcript_43080/g.100043  ORF Transcript_43080/g.100043 Transcript_43080/m.100043 type:complete len:184 (+) Transcript_43080:140-691(+)